MCVLCCVCIVFVLGGGSVSRYFVLLCCVCVFCIGMIFLVVCVVVAWCVAFVCVGVFVYCFLVGVC